MHGRRGGSTHTTGPVGVADHVRDAAALLRHLGVGRAHLAGHSSGGAVALQLAMDHPELVRSVILLEPTILSVPGASGFLHKAGPVFEAYAAGDHETALALFMSTVTGLEWSTCRALVEDRVPGAVAAALTDVHTFFGVELPALTQWSFDAKSAAAVSQPVLSVVGSETQPLWVEIAACLRAWLPGIEECKIAGVGHLLHVQQPEPVARGMARFLERQPIG